MITLISPHIMTVVYGKGMLYLEKDSYEYIAKRCEEALINNEGYTKLERSDAGAEEIQEMAEVLCYQKGFKDAVRMFIECM